MMNMVNDNGGYGVIAGEETIITKLRKKRKPLGESFAKAYENAIFDFGGEEKTILDQTQDDLSCKQADYSGLDREKNGLDNK